MEEKDLKIEETSLNKTEETSLEGKKENIVLRGLKAFWKYLKDIFLNFKESFKYNNIVYSTKVIIHENNKGELQNEII